MKHEHEIENLIKSTVQNEGLAKPGDGFTDKLMSSLEGMPLVTPAYRPLLSQKRWTWIACILIAFVALILFIPQNLLSGYVLDYDSVDKVISRFSSFRFHIEVPKLVTTITLCVLPLLLLQFFIISKFIRKLL